jgi:serine/threonine-protein kinase
VNPEIPKPLELICMKAMAPDRERRYDSADAMVVDLDAFRKNPGVNLDIDLQSLRREEADEPTRLLHTGSTASLSRHANTGRVKRYEEEEREDMRKQPRTSPVQRVLMVLAALRAIVTAFFFWAKAVLGSMDAGQTYTVPKVVGKQIAEARIMEGVAGIFEIEEIESVYDAAPVGQIIKQDPAEGRQTKTDLIIRVTVSAGEWTEAMPDLIGQVAQVARVSLKQLKDDFGLVVETLEENSDTVTAGSVIRTEPVAGTTLKQGDSVTLYVSLGPVKVPVTVISFVSQTIETAKEQAKALGLIVHEIDVDSDQPAGIVVKQDVDQGTQLYQGDSITLSVSKGPTNTPPPVQDPVPSGPMHQKNVSFPLPQDGRDMVDMVVLVEDQTAYDGSVDCSLGEIPVDLWGSGTQTVRVYYDGLLYGQYTVNFDE